MTTTDASGGSSFFFSSTTTPMTQLALIGAFVLMLASVSTAVPIDFPSDDQHHNIIASVINQQASADQQQHGGGGGGGGELLAAATAAEDGGINEGQSEVKPRQFGLELGLFDGYNNGRFPPGGAINPYYCGVGYRYPGPLYCQYVGGIAGYPIGGHFGTFPYGYRCVCYPYHHFNPYFYGGGGGGQGW